MRVQHLLSLLPERDRTILTLRYLQGYSAAEIARALGTSAGHIRVLQLRALRRAAQVEIMERNRYRMQEQESPFDSFAKLMAPESRRVLDLAREEILSLKHWWIGTEHVLWGLASEESLTSFLTPLGITPERIHAGIVFIFDRPTHLLLGLMNEGEGIGAGLLRSLGIGPLQARTALVPPEVSQICSFCGRFGSQVSRLFPAEVGTASSSASESGPFICDHCVRRFHTMLGTPST
jgi:hypothetical protein